MHSLHCPMGKSIQGPSEAAWIQGAQHVKGCKTYLLSVFLFLFCLSFIKPFVCQAFLTEIQHELCTLSLLKTGAEQWYDVSSVQITQALKLVGIIYLFHQAPCIKAAQVLC